MINGSLWEAVNTKQPNVEQVKIAKSLPRICFFSGLTGEEIMVFIDAFPESDIQLNFLCFHSWNTHSNIDMILQSYERIIQTKHTYVEYIPISSSPESKVIGCG